MTGDAETSIETLVDAAEHIEAMRPEGGGLHEVVGDKGYHSNQSLVDVEAVAVRSYIPESDRGRRNWKRSPRPVRRCIAFGDGIRGALGLRPKGSAQMQFFAFSSFTDNLPQKDHKPPVGLLSCSFCANLWRFGADKPL
jgi:hypothetical protein